MWSVWCGKVLVHVVENTLIVWEDLGSSPMCVIKLVLFLCILKRVVDLYNYWIILVSMKHELVALVRHWVGMCMGVGSNLGRPKWNCRQRKEAQDYWGKL